MKYYTLTFEDYIDGELAYTSGESNSFISFDKAELESKLHSIGYKAMQDGHKVHVWGKGTRTVETDFMVREFYIREGEL